MEEAMRHTGWQQLKANEKKGVSMAVVLCVSAFFIAFAAAILYTAGLMTFCTDDLQSAGCS